MIMAQMRSRGALLASSNSISSEGSYSHDFTSGCPPPPLTRQTPLYAQSFKFRASPLQQLVRSIIHAVTFGVGYIIMLLAMYFNGFIILSIIIGAGAGKYFADWMVVEVVPGLPGVAGVNVKGGEGAKGIEEVTVCCG